MSRRKGLAGQIPGLCGDFVSPTSLFRDTSLRDGRLSQMRGVEKAKRSRGEEVEGSEETEERREEGRGERRERDREKK